MTADDDEAYALAPMKPRMMLLAYLLLMSSAEAQFTFNPLPPSQNVLNKYFQQSAGCECWVGYGRHTQFPDTLLDNIQVSPTRVVTRVGQPVKIRIDASAMCMGQTIRDLNGVSGPTHGPLGHVSWRAGSVQDLPDIYGEVKFDGYDQPISDTVVVDVGVQCYDTGVKCQTANKYATCRAQVSIPLTVLPANATEADIQNARKAAKMLKPRHKKTAKKQLNSHLAKGVGFSKKKKTLELSASNDGWPALTLQLKT